ncbi:MAG: alpha/beta hydrolase [Rhodospirillaceae bacterium]|nr:alpha/beta hydrolase [Rhodospirillaceae bacterium]
MKSMPFRISSILGGEIEYSYIASSKGDNATIVLLHEGLGSLSTWKNFPDLVHYKTGCAVLAYSRHGYGNSSFVKTAFDICYMHQEALEVLPKLLDDLEITNPILYGHSDGASIALIHTGGLKRVVRAIILEAPHVFVESISINGIKEAKKAFENGPLKSSLAKHHADPDSTFANWSNAWLNPDFLNWNIESYLEHIKCPTLLIQGRNDAYGTLRQIDAIETGVRGICAKIVLDDTGHSPYREATEAVLSTVNNFILKL